MIVCTHISDLKDHLSGGWEGEMLHVVSRGTEIYDPKEIRRTWTESCACVIPRLARLALMASGDILPQSSSFKLICDANISRGTAQSSFGVCAPSRGPYLEPSLMRQCIFTITLRGSLITVGGPTGINEKGLDP